ncbi:MAG: S9 family peptidase [Acidobacteriota bacterium]|nr:S9 family peptidase [Acidobacteriota bacterium]
MTSPQTKPYGTWKSPITSELIVSRAIGLGEVRLDGEDIYWSELRPSEGGRICVVQHTSDGRVIDRLPAPFNARTRVHEYGGGAYSVKDGILYFSNFEDQILYRQEGDNAPEPITKDPAMRYADGVVDPSRNRIILVREDHRHPESEAINTIAGIDLTNGESSVLASGNDFYASPRISPDGCRLAWMTWHHPKMPWDGSELWVADVIEDGTLRNQKLVAGGENESVFQPEWSPDGVLYFVSDRTGWWNLYRESGEGVESMCAMEAEFGMPQWVFGMSTYAFASKNEIVCTFTQNGEWTLATIDTVSLELKEIGTPFTDVSDVQAGSGFAVFRAGSPMLPASIVRLDLQSHEIATLRRSSNVNVEAGFLSEPRSIEFPTAQGLTAHAIFYPPNNKDYRAPEGERPPLIVKSHGGPTAAADATFNLRIQYWTSRGFGVVDVNYGGSTGYGRAYRERLDGVWGIVDVEDCVNAAKFLVEQGEADSDRLAITGGSAGGYTTLCALTFHDVFSAGASHYGVSDLEALAVDTHKFESRYLDGLIGPYPEQKELYRRRSPIHSADRLSCPLIVFQGLEDKVVPPNQAEAIVEAVRKKGLPVAYVPFEGEQHGFRRAENIRRALDGELDFYARIFGFEPADELEPVPIENID